MRELHEMARQRDASAADVAQLHEAFANSMKDASALGDSLKRTIALRSAAEAEAEGLRTELQETRARLHETEVVAHRGTSPSEAGVTPTEAAATGEVRTTPAADGQPPDSMQCPGGVAVLVDGSTQTFATARLTLTDAERQPAGDTSMLSQLQPAGDTSMLSPREIELSCETPRETAGAAPMPDSPVPPSSMPDSPVPPSSSRQGGGLWRFVEVRFAAHDRLMGMNLRDVPGG